MKDQRDQSKGKHTARPTVGIYGGETITVQPLAEANSRRGGVATCAFILSLVFRKSSQTNVESSSRQQSPDLDILTPKHSNVCPVWLCPLV